MRIAHGSTFVAAFLIFIVNGVVGCRQSTPAPTTSTSRPSDATTGESKTARETTGGATGGTTSETAAASPSQSRPDVALAPLGESPLLNTLPKAAYVGSQACVECHPDEYESYRRTPHSMALADIQLDAEPPDAQFVHEPTARVYRNYRQAGRLWHRESLRTDSGQQLELGDYPVRYVIGSGNHSRSYLVEIDGFLVESPLTWYTSRKEWSLSPGYDKTQFGFSRPASLQCLGCHAGRVESVQGSVHRLKLHEYAIGCERCHGPGSLHVKRWNSEGHASGELNNASNDGADLTIAQPARLARHFQEAVCDQCHLRSAATVSVRSRAAGDFQPGRRLQDFQVHYWLKNPNQEMKVAGHSEQMRLSLCYEKSEALTCLTCHNPHDKPAHEMGQAYYRQQCLSCHDSEASCGLEKPARLKQSPQDDCVGCHMPKVPIDIPHFAFTHHRIGIHKSPPTDGLPQVTKDTGKGIAKDGANNLPATGNLEPMHDLSHFSAYDQKRCLGLGYLDLAGAAFLKNDFTAFGAYRERAQKILEEVYAQGVRDPEVEVALAGLFSDKDPSRAVHYARLALERESELSPDSRANAHLIVGAALFKSQDNRGAIRSLEKLVQLRRNVEDWTMLGVSRVRAGDPRGALTDLKHAAEIGPARPDVHQILADLYRITGDAALGRQHQQKAVMFSRSLSR